ncbi:fungal-specific transcription factor domain-containing protein [Vararia minispora EC-137]|uniref:Fungal-specific transcription factor domain-containing protein n=1 Tax=Vararia minispora EC-137 TaxID=1314806 RepID=A0ACB8QXM9_9AGAM|nr:fungal-specific transcription factor domain-containing protein [Vararia minispora EC-137]
MRSHNGNRPSLPQSKHCPLCPAKFTRTTHLNRHLRTHTNERLHRCDTCMAEFTRSDLLTRHKRSCGDLANQNKSRRKSCQACAESKVKCDLKQPCTKCISRGKDCVFLNDPNQSREKKAAALARRKAKLAAQQQPPPPAVPELDPSTSTSSSSRSSPSPVSNPSVALTPVGPFAIDDASSEPSLFDFSASDLLFASPMSDVGPPHCADIAYPYPDPAIPSVYPPSAPPFLSPPTLAPDVPSYAELQHYLYLFHTSFLSHIPLLHLPTWSLDTKPDLLVRAMYASGALFVKTPLAQHFVATTLAAARDQFRQAAETPPSSLEDQLHLLLAGLLLQSIWFMHHSFADREESNVYHGMLVMMIHRCGLVARCAAWTPPRLEGAAPAVVDAAWRDWAFQETIKRTLCVAYLHDVWFAVFFGIPPSLLQSTVDWSLPSDDALWRANSSREWLDVLRMQHPSPYGSPSARLTGFGVKNALSVLGAMHVTPLALPLSAFAHFFLVHAVLMSIYTPAFDPSPSADAQGSDSFVLQHALHNWFNSWTHAPDADIGGGGGGGGGGEMPRLVQNARPYYLLAQVSLLAGTQTADLLRLAPPARYRVLQQWIPHIRNAIRSGEQAPPAFWVEIMRMAVKDTDTDMDAGGEGLVLFFPEL